MRTATALAHPNIALVKYWGKRDDDLNLPAAPSLAITLSGLNTITTVSESLRDEVRLNGEYVQDVKINQWLEVVRSKFEVPSLSIDSCSDFPTSSGLASSASGFAALTLAVSATCDLNWSTQALCEWARRGSASGARSIYGGFTVMEPENTVCHVRQLLAEDAWDLAVVVAITTDKVKRIGSTEGMTASRATSPFYNAWLDVTKESICDGIQAVVRKDFHSLARVAESSCRQMHAIMLSTEPALIYWNGATLLCIESILRMRESGINVFYTVDAGAHVKAICESSVVEQVNRTLRSIHGVNDVVVSRIGGSARLLG